jgi:hypothetical protein
MFVFMIIIDFVFMMNKNHIPKMWGRTWLLPHPRMPPTLGLYPTLTIMNHTLKLLKNPLGCVLKGTYGRPHFYVIKILAIFFENLATMSHIYTRKTQISKNFCWKNSKICWEKNTLTLHLYLWILPSSQGHLLPSRGLLHPITEVASIMLFTLCFHHAKI